VAAVTGSSIFKAQAVRMADHTVAVIVMVKTALAGSVVTMIACDAVAVLAYLLRCHMRDRVISKTIRRGRALEIDGCPSCLSGEAADRGVRRSDAAADPLDIGGVLGMAGFADNLPILAGGHSPAAAPLRCIGESVAVMQHGAVPARRDSDKLRVPSAGAICVNVGRPDVIALICRQTGMVVMKGDAA